MVQNNICALQRMVRGMKTQYVNSDRWDPRNGQRKHQARGGTPFYPSERGANGSREMYVTKKSHVCLVWLKSDPRDVISDSKKTEINEALLRWELGGHSVSLWMLDPTDEDTEDIEERGYTERVFDIRTILDMYQYVEAFLGIKYLFLKIDILKFLIPLYILQYGLSNTTFENCIACDLDVGTRDGGVTDEGRVFDLKYVYDNDTNEKLDRMGVVFAEGLQEYPDIQLPHFTNYENSFAIFRNDKHVKESMAMFVSVLMDPIAHKIYPTEETVWTYIPSFFEYLKCKRYNGIPYNGYFKLSKNECLLWGPRPSRWCETNEQLWLSDFVKKVPIPTSRLSGGKSRMDSVRHLKSTVPLALLMLGVTLTASIVGALM